jgi:GT2 family glycosyltransferase
VNLGTLNMTAKVPIIILNCNGLEDTIERLESLYCVAYNCREEIDTSMERSKDWTAGAETYLEHARSDVPWAIATGLSFNSTISGQSD